MPNRENGKENTLVPVYGFLQGDTMGLVALVHGFEKISVFADRLQQAAGTRVPKQEGLRVRYKGKFLDMEATIENSGIQPLERLDVVRSAN